MRLGSAQGVLTARQCAGILKALADETRLRILESLLLREKCVNELAQELRFPQPHISHHLRILRASNLVEGVREGKQVCYRISPRVQRVLPKREGQALNFGCCELRFAEPIFTSLSHTH